jgi:[protein-PII] uridylyltransferase
MVRMARGSSTLRQIGSGAFDMVNSARTLERRQAAACCLCHRADVLINNQWSNRYTVAEVSGLDRPGLLYELTATLSKLNLNIASAHVATFGERVVDVFYVTDLLGAQIVSPTRQAAIKRALIQLLAGAGEGAAARVG